MNQHWETKRLVLRPSAPELAGEVARYFAKNKEFHRETDPVRPDEFYTEEGQRALLCQDAARQEEGRCLRLWLSLKEEPERIIGFVGLSEIVRGAFLSCFMGYHMDGELINAVLFGYQRKISDIIYFATAIPAGQNEETDI